MRLAGLLVGLVFGVTLSWTGHERPRRDPRRAAVRGVLPVPVLRLGGRWSRPSACGCCGGGARCSRGERIDWRSTPVQRRHIAGSVLFGTGWALADACPGPIATQLGQGIVWSLFTLAGVVAGIWVFLRRQPSAIDA